MRITQTSEKGPARKPCRIWRSVRPRLHTWITCISAQLPTRTHCAAAPVGVHLPVSGSRASFPRSKKSGMWGVEDLYRRRRLHFVLFLSDILGLKSRPVWSDLKSLEVNFGNYGVRSPSCSTSLGRPIMGFLMIRSR